jgi:hypothetical protein
MIIASVIAAATTLMQPADDTTWWRTKGAEVIQETGQNVCALFFFQRENAVGFLWDKSALTGVVFFNERWSFEPGETRAAVRIGDNWIADNAGIDWFRATVEKDALMVPIRYYPVESMLKNASVVSVRHQNSEFEVQVDKAKMPKLLEAVTTCRQHLA